MASGEVHVKHFHRKYAVAHLRERLAEDSRTHEQTIQIEQQGIKVLLRGEVSSHETKEATEQIAKETLPNALIESQIRVSPLDDPIEVEEMK
jgi:hypothetical protein